MRILSTLLVGLFAFDETLAFTFDEQMAYRNLQITAATYCDFTDWSCIHCIPDVDLIDYIRDDTNNIVVAFDTVQNATVFAFRGSSDIENWISNFEFVQTSPYAEKEIKVHEGLYEEYSKYKDWLFDHLPKTGNVVMTGHSSGGALAMFFASENLRFSLTAERSSAPMAQEPLPSLNSKRSYAQEPPPSYVPPFPTTAKKHPYSSKDTPSPPTVYTFGKPRIGNKKFVDYVTSLGIQHYRITHHHDIVPHLPEEVILDYRHTNTEIWYPDDGNTYKICEQSEDKSCSNSCAPLQCVSTSDHLYYMQTHIGGGDC